MKLIGFSISKDCIALERGPDYFDLHNNFDFQSLLYDLAQRTLHLRWGRGGGGWVKPTEPSELLLVFAGVYLFKTHQRDPAMPFTEDSCLDSIGFIWDDLLEEMQGFASNQPGDRCTHLNATFMSGFSIKVGAESVSLQVTSSA